MPTQTISLAALTGAAGRTLIQGLLIHGPSGYRIIVQADDVAGQAEQNLVFRILDPTGRLVATVTVVGGGHGSSCGLDSTGPDSWRLWFGHATRGQTGYVSWKIGQGSGTGVFTPAAKLPRGDVSIDQARDVLMLRNGNRFRGYSLASVKAGAPKQLRDPDGDPVDFTIPSWGNRFQGHMVHDGRLFVHRDIATGKESRAHVFTFAGKPVTVPPNATADGPTDPRNWIATTGMGDEAEGFVVVVDADGQEVVCVVKRTGGNNAKRVVDVTHWLVVHPKGVSEVSKVKFRNGYTCECLAAIFPSIEQEMIAAGIIKKSIDVWQWGYRTDVAASALTHAGGGVLDVQQYSDAALKIWREWGVEMQHRTEAQGFDVEHGHGVVKGCPHVSKGRSGAAWQQTEWEAGRNGLKGQGKITGPGPIGKATPTWQQAIEAHQKRKTLAEWIAELGPVTDVSVAAINKARGTSNASRYVAVMQAWLNLAMQPKPLLVVDGIWSATGPTQQILDAFRKGLGWTDYKGELGVHSLTQLHDHPAVAATNPLPVREQMK